MKTIWKFVLDAINAKDLQSFMLPVGAKLLYAREQDNKVCVWAEVDPLAWQEERIFEVFSTGQTWPDDSGVERVYLGSAHLYGGDLVFHVYERKP